MYTTGMAGVASGKLISFELQPKYTKIYNDVHTQGVHRVMIKHSHV